MKFIGRCWDILVTLALFFMMLFGYLLYFILLPFYRFRWWTRLLIVCSVLMLGGAAIGYFVLLKKAADKRERTPVVESVLIVDKGSNLNRISTILRKYGIIDSPLQFKILAVLKGEAGRLKAGRYRFTNNMPLNDILYSLSHGSVYNNHLVIPEGTPSWEVASMLKQTMDMDSAAFMDAVQDAEFTVSLGIHAPTLEGYLYPDTYWFQWDANPAMSFAIWSSGSMKSGSRFTLRTKSPRHSTRLKL